MKIHEYLEIATTPTGEQVIRCVRCGHEFCSPRENYKLHALYRERNLSDWPFRQPYSGDPAFVVYQEYICPGCGLLLEVDNYCPALDKEEEKVLWDIQVEVG